MNDRARQAAARTILRALYAPDQLRERLTWFWFNHFNVHQYKANIRVLVGDYEDRAIRANALGKFRNLLSATLHHPVMLRYLDNADNAAGHLNENYAREVLQLFTIGLWQLNPDGSQKLDGQGQPIPSYDQDTVEGFAHAFT
ncbi:DUF1800 family protein, partial [Escherichia coli]|uniref:DUF1800 family protein n=1 Tax=Escherichia coli TaxID=562 RepID=UPI00207B3887